MRKLISFLLHAILSVFCVVAVASAEGGVSKKRIRPYLYGNVVMATTTTAAGVQSVSFDHWNHRQNFSCRLCHVDLAFSMNVGETQVTAADNERGNFCGACHNGTFVFAGKPLFASCRSNQKPLAEPCTLCHTAAVSRQKEEKFIAFSAGLPKERLGNGIDWEKAEIEGKTKLIDSLEKVPVKRKTIATREDFDLTAKTEGMPEIVFSHKKHTLWGGCESCHPDIFIGVKKGTNSYSMVDLFAGRYCGACHGKVAFPTSDCQRCHTKPVM